MNILSVSKFLYFLSIIIWLFPPFRQYRGKYFLFFLILALMDPVALGYGFIFRQNFPIQISTIFVFFLLISLVPRDFFRKYYPVFASLFLVLVILTLFALNHTQNYGVIILINCGIFLIILKDFITSYARRGNLSLFYFFFIFYELTLIMKLLNVILGFADATAFYVLTSITQIIFGIFFTIYREDKAGNTV